MKELKELEENLLGQLFTQHGEESIVERCKQIASMYAEVENSIAVLSNLKEEKSYIYNGALAEVLALNEKKGYQEIDSIWEEDIYHRIHPDDLAARHVLELKFFQLLKKCAADKRKNYRTHSVIRMHNGKGVYKSILHRTFYLCNQADNTLWMALCLYNLAPNSELAHHFEGSIQNSQTGELIKINHHSAGSLITEREKEVLQLIEQGFPSKQIAVKLGVSKNTIDRHRQNIMEKLRVGNSMEAVKVASNLGLI